ncbi:hypothetical protein ANN_13722 [Periplaneta americana]|uniref:PiggyBac transposable element-derived protein domain-containing protein n=1 Tax=Periplaneta americana TaxID=6978 RepID=A0ABQ8SUB4_PERAM|nr:hypothetical protein ANN_13722 [Periplaneta americana]
MSVQCNKYLSDKEIQEDLHNSWDQNFIVSDEDVSEVEDNIVQYNDTAPVSESEDDMNDSVADNDNINNTSVREYVAKSGRRYLSQPPRGRRRSTQNIIRERPGLRPEGNVTSILDSFSKFFTSDIIRIIVQYTNKEAQRKGINVTNETEIMSLIGIFILMAANDDTKLDYHDLWSERFGRPVYLATMSRNRFRELVKVIRFDDKNTREDRRKEISLLHFVKTVSVQGVYEGKPGKYGVLIRILADCKERYVLRMEVYAGKIEDSTPESRGPKSIVKRLATPLKGSGRNITTDRYYTSVELAEELYTDYGLTLVGTMQTKRKHIPEELKTTKIGRFTLTNSLSQIPIQETHLLLWFLTSPVKSPKKILVLLSTQHKDATVENDGKKNKSHINLFYNETKGGVDTIDQMARKYSTKRGTRRWPLSVFFTLIDIAAINGYCLYLMNDPNWEKTRTNRHRIYLQELGLKLIERKVQDRAKNVSGLKNNAVIAMENILSIKIKPPVADTGDNIAQGTSSTIGKKRCYICWQVSSKEE